MIETSPIQPCDVLYRWLHPGQFHWEEKRATSAAFRDKYMSVDIARLTTISESYERAEKIGKNAVVSFSVSIAFEKNQKVLNCPTLVLEEDSSKYLCLFETECPIYSNDPHQNFNCFNSAHGCVIGKKTSSVAKALSKGSRVEVWPPDP